MREGRERRDERVRRGEGRDESGGGKGEGE